jgi:dUTP pyrophosphatase
MTLPVSIPQVWNHHFSHLSGLKSFFDATLLLPPGNTLSNNFDQSYLHSPRFRTSPAGTFTQILRSENAGNLFLTDSTAQNHEDTSRAISQEIDYSQQYCAYIIRTAHTTPFPTKDLSEAAGYNVYCIQKTTVPAGDRVLLQVGLRVKPPPNCYTCLASRSSLSLHYGLLANGGVIDPDCTGEISLLMFNHSKTDVILSPGNCIGQLIFEQ